MYNIGHGVIKEKELAQAAPSIRTEKGLQTRVEYGAFNLTDVAFY